MKNIRGQIADYLHTVLLKKLINFKQIPFEDFFCDCISQDIIIPTRKDIKNIYEETKKTNSN